MPKSINKRLGKYNDMLGDYKVKRLSFLRLLAIDGFDALQFGHNMMALIEFDITEARKALRGQKKSGKKVSLFTFIIKSIAVALSKYKKLNSIRRGNRIIEFKDIDINIPVELNSEGEKFGGKFPHQIVIRDAANKTIEEIYQEINAAKRRHQQSGDTGKEDKWVLHMMKMLLILPRFIRILILKIFANNPFTVKRMSGTTFITSVATFTSGFVIPYIGGSRAVSFALGGIVKKPAVVDDDILIREFLSMTVIFNHDIVDGAPAARFVKYLKKVIENINVLLQNNDV